MPALFVYGSNLDTRQMVKRCPSAALMFAAVLPHWRLSFVGYSRTRLGAVATVARINAESQNVPQGGVPGLVYFVNAGDLSVMDAYEGAPSVYQREQLKVWPLSAAKQRRVECYVHTPAEPGLPGMAYLKQILDAYDRVGFPYDHVQSALADVVRASGERADKKRTH